MCRWGQKKWIVLTVLHSEQLHTNKIWICYHNMCVRWISWQYHFEENALPLSRAPHFFTTKKILSHHSGRNVFSPIVVFPNEDLHTLNLTGPWIDALSNKRATRNVCIDGKASLSGFYWLCDAAWKLPASLVSGHLIAIVLVSVHWSTSLSLGLDFASVPWSCRSIFWPSVAEICLITDLTGGWPDSREVVVSSDCCRWHCAVSFSPLKPTFFVFLFVLSHGISFRRFQSAL